MTEAELGRFLKDGLGEPVYSPALASRVVRAVRADGRHELKVGTTRKNRTGLGRRLSLAVVPVALAAALNAPAVYFVPRYAAALADAPVAGAVSRPILSGVGLAPTDVSATSDVATSSGHTLRLVGAYTDGVQTVFFVQVDGESLANAGTPSKADRYLVVGEAALTDQFGHPYERAGAVNGDQRPVVFAPLSGPAATAGGRLTLHVQRLVNVGAVPLETVEGSWTLHATLLPHPARDLSLPAPASVGGNTYTVTSARASSVLYLSWEVTGPAVDEAIAGNTPGAGRVSSHDLFVPEVVGSRAPMESGWVIDSNAKAVKGQLTIALIGATEYDLRFGSSAAGFVDRTIRVA